MFRSAQRRTAKPPTLELSPDRAFVVHLDRHALPPRHGSGHCVIHVLRLLLRVSFYTRPPIARDGNGFLSNFNDRIQTFVSIGGES